MRFALVLLCLVACGSTSESPAASPSKPWTRVEWLTAADQLATKMAAGPALADASSRATFTKLVTTDAWRQLDRTMFAGEGEVLRFFPTYKRVYMTLAANGSAKDVVTLSLYGMDVYAAFMRAGNDFIEHLPAGDKTRGNRENGMNKVRLGLAIELCTLLYAAMDADDEARTAALGTLSDAKTYASHSREGLQLILATLDENILPTVPPNLRESYGRVRDAVAREHAAREAPVTSERTTYQGLHAPAFRAARPLVVVSKTGGFSVGFGLALGVEPLAKRVEINNAGVASVQHWINHEIDGTTFEAACFEQMTESDIVAGFERMANLSPRPSSRPGRSFAMKSAERDVRIRITTIGTRACIASVEGPPARFPAAVADTFVDSLDVAR